MAKSQVCRAIAAHLPQLKEADIAEAVNLLLTAIAQQLKEGGKGARFEIRLPLIARSLNGASSDLASGPVRMPA